MRKQHTIIPAALAVILTLSAATGSAWAYFTTYAQARGSYPIRLGDQTTVTEDFSAWTKHVSIQSSADSKPVYIRVRAFCGEAYSLVYSDSTGKWNPESDGYYYYSGIVKGGEATDTLDIKIENVPQDIKDAASFNVVVIYETTPVQYHEDGTPYADWSSKLESGTVEGGA